MRLASALVLWLLLAVGAAYGAAGDFTTKGTVRATAIELSGTTAISASGAGQTANITNISGTLIQAGASAAACGASIPGAIRYNATSDTLQVCSAAGWKSLVSGTAVGGGGSSSWYDLTSIPAQVQQVSNSGAISLTALGVTNLSATAIQSPGGNTNIIFTNGQTLAGNGSFGWNNTTKLLTVSGTAAAATALQVNGSIRATGTISASDIVQVGSTTTIACASSVQGALRYTNVSDSLQVCTGSGWKSLISTTTVGGGLQCSQSGDVNLGTLLAGHGTAFTHGLGVTPTISNLFMRNLVGNAGYGVGDILEPSGAMGSSTGSGAIYGLLQNSTSTTVIVGNNAFVIPHRTTGGATSITSASWAIFVKVCG